MSHDDDPKRVPDVSKAPAIEAQEFIPCEECRQTYDRRIFGQVLYHAQPGHKPYQKRS